MNLLISARTLLPHILPCKGFGNVLVLHAKYCNVHSPLTSRLKNLELLTELEQFEDA